MGEPIEEYNKRMNRDLKQPKGANTVNKPGGKSPSRLAAEAKKAKLMSEVGTNKTKTKSVLGVTDFAKKPKAPTTKNVKKGTLGARNPAGPDTSKMKVSQGSKMAKNPAPVKKTKKAPIVTEKMLKDSGYTNLRDYMNAKQGKTRRDGKAASRTTAAKKKDMMSGSFKAGGAVKKMMGGGMTKGKMMKYRGGGIVQQGARPTKYI